MRQAYHERPSWEVRALLMNAVAEAEVRRGDYEPPAEPINPPDTPAPAWVMELDT